MTRFLDGLEDFIEKPSNLSRHLLEIILDIEEKHKHSSGINNWLGRMINSVKIRLQYLNEYYDIYDFLKKHRRRQCNSRNSLEVIECFFEEFREIYKVISLNNFLLAYAYFLEKDSLNPVLNKEDERLLSFRDFYHGKVSFEEIKKRYGHYALNPFELSSRRFTEYRKEELIKLAKYTENFKTEKTIGLEKYIQKRPPRLFPVYSSLREELKYYILFVVNDLRFYLLKFAKEKKIDNIFQIKYEDLIVMKNDN